MFLAAAYAGWLRRVGAYTDFKAPPPASSSRFENLSSTPSSRERARRIELENEQRHADAMAKLPKIRPTPSHLGPLARLTK
jgi:hypothetical protein